MAVSITSGSPATRRRSSGCWARCHNEAPMADQVVSMPAIMSSTIVPRTCSSCSLLPSISACRRNEVRSSRGRARWSSIWAFMYSSMSPLSIMASLFGRLIDGFEHLVDESPEDVGVLLGEPEHLHDYPDRDVLGVFDGRVELGAGPPRTPAGPGRASG